MATTGSHPTVRLKQDPRTLRNSGQLSVEEGAEERVVVTGIGQVDGDGLHLGGRGGSGLAVVTSKTERAAVAARSVSVRGAGPGRISAAWAFSKATSASAGESKVSAI
ncbi:hypothetical protein GCM10020256_11470 [Streptomyces thermocoprophilus]